MKDRLKKRLEELNIASQQIVANHNVIVGAKNEVELLITQLEAEEAPKLEAVADPVPDAQCEVA